jgi:protoporphyrinogen oxidase
MTRFSPKSAVIVGAGVAGLTLGYLLKKEGWEITVIERDKTVGGLARSFQYDDFIFDIGPKRFHTDDKEVLLFLHEILQGDHLIVTRSSSVYLFGRYFDWPLNSKALFKLPPSIMIRAFMDLIRKREVHHKDSFSEYTQSRYGETLYKLFFKPYTEKFLRIPCEQVHVDWAKTGINRAVIDKRVKSESLSDLIKTVLLPKPVKTEFIYPSYGGFGTFCKKLEAKLREMGGKILLNTTISWLNLQGHIISEVLLTDGTRLRPDYVVWSGNLLNLAQLLAQPTPKIKYLSTICYNLQMKGDPLRRAQWIYYGGADLCMSRVSITKEMAPYMAPEGMSGLCVEVTCLEGDEIWKTPESLVEQIKKDLVRVKLVPQVDCIFGVHIERIRDSYPIYDLDYRKNFSQAAKIAKPFKNLKLLGRTGAFWYNNSDHSMKMSIDMAKHLVHGHTMAEKDEYFRA